MIAYDDETDSPAERLNRPVCRRCGSDQLASIERSISWRDVDFTYWHPTAEDRARSATLGEPAPRAGWTTGNSWGDDIGDSDSTTIGVACTDCYATTGEAESFGALITTRAAFERMHPRRAWWVIVERCGRALDGPREERRVRISARTAREAMEAASEYGMSEDGYPWRARGFRYAFGDQLAADRYVWPVGQPRPATVADGTIRP